jgi:transposase
VADFTFPDLRNTAVSWYARAGSTKPEIASITGHSLASIYTILKHYLALDAELADNAVKKLVDYMERERLAV